MSGSRKSSIARIFWFALLGFSLLLIWNSLPYFDFLPNHAFVSEKFSHWLEPLWRVCFYNHVAAGVVCLVSALLSFSTTILKRWPKVHRISGRVYVFSVCLLLVPTGLYMSFFAKGGILGVVGFLLNGVLLFIPTVLGVRSILARNITAHRRWMIRSYAMAATAISFRVLHLVFAWFSAQHAYVAGIWGSVIVNALLAEFIIRYKHRKGVQHEILSLWKSSYRCVSLWLGLHSSGRKP